MVSSRLLNVLDAFGPKLNEKTSVERCDCLLSALIEEFDIEILNRKHFDHILQCKSQEEKDNFRLAQDIAMVREILENFKSSKTHLGMSRYTYEYNQDILERFNTIQSKVYSIVFKD